MENGKSVKVWMMKDWSKGFLTKIDLRFNIIFQHLSLNFPLQNYKNFNSFKL